MDDLEEPLNPNQLKILYALTKHGGKASFNHMLTEVGMDAAMFINTSRLLIRKCLVRQGETFDVFEITDEGIKVLEEAMAQTEPTTAKETQQPIQGGAKLEAKESAPPPSENLPVGNDEKTPL
jgi:predicted transcriptional regulator